MKIKTAQKSISIYLLIVILGSFFYTFPSFKDLNNINPQVQAQSGSTRQKCNTNGNYYEGYFKKGAPDGKHRIDIAKSSNIAFADENYVSDGTDRSYSESKLNNGSTRPKDQIIYEDKTIGNAGVASANYTGISIRNFFDPLTTSRPSQSILDVWKLSTAVVGNNNSLESLSTVNNSIPFIFGNSNRNNNYTANLTNEGLLIDVKMDEPKRVFNMTSIDSLLKVNGLDYATNFKYKYDFSIINDIDVNDTKSYHGSLGIEYLNTNGFLKGDVGTYSVGSNNYYHNNDNSITNKNDISFGKYIIMRNVFNNESRDVKNDATSNNYGIGGPSDGRGLNYTLLRKSDNFSGVENGSVELKLDKIDDKFRLNYSISKKNGSENREFKSSNFKTDIGSLSTIRLFSLDNEDNNQKRQSRFYIKNVRVDWATEAKAYSSQIIKTANSNLIWDHLNVKYKTPDGTNIKIYATDGGSNETIIFDSSNHNKVNFAEQNIDLSTKITNLNSLNTIYLYAVLTRNSPNTETPTLFYWKVDCKPNIIQSCSYSVNNSSTAPYNISVSNPNISIRVNGTTTELSKINSDRGSVAILNSSNNIVKNFFMETVTNLSTFSINNTTGEFEFNLGFNYLDYSTLRDSLTIAIVLPGTTTQISNSHNNLINCRPRNIIFGVPSSPSVNSITLECVNNNPYSLKAFVKLNPSNITNARINNINIFLSTINNQNTLPLNNSIDIGYNHNPVKYINSTNSNKISNGNLNNNVLTFNITFDKNDYTSVTSFRKIFGDYNDTANKSINFFWYVTDDKGQVSDQSNYKVTKVNFNPFDSCVQLYYTTSLGDVRSTESQTLGTLKNYDRVYKSLSTISAIIPTRSSKNILSSYTFEYLSSTNNNLNDESCKNFSTFSNKSNLFCRSTIQNNKYKIQQQINDFKNLIINNNYHIEEVKSNTLIQNSNDSNVRNLDLNKYKNLSTNNTLVIRIKDNTSNYINILNSDVSTDSTTQKIIIWCDFENCKLIVNKNSNSTNSDIIFNNNILSGNNSFKENQKFRIYFVPSGNIYLSPNYESINNSVSNFNGAFITNGYIYSARSRKTTLINGLVVSKGIVARGGNLSTNINIFNANSNSTFIFDDYVNVSNSTVTSKPFLHINYDPRYISIINSQNLSNPADVPRQIIGL